MEKIEAHLGDIEYSYYHLLQVVTTSGSSKTEELIELGKKSGFRYINLGLKLSQRLLELTDRQKILRLQYLLDDIMGDNMGQTVLLDNTELGYFKSKSNYQHVSGLKSLTIESQGWSGWFSAKVKDWVMQYLELNWGTIGSKDRNVFPSF